MVFNKWRFLQCHSEVIPVCRRMITDSGWFDSRDSLALVCDFTQPLSFGASLRALQRPSLKRGHSIVDATRTARVIVDLGCGVGLTTAARKQLYPKAKVYGTNLKDTKQWKFCERMARQYDFTLVDDLKRIKQSADIVFASEYFEHIQRPIDHLAEIIDAISPKHFIVLRFTRET